MRTALLTWEFKCLDLILLADESYHDQEKAVEVMKQLNSDRCACSASYVLSAVSHCCISDTPKTSLCSATPKTSLCYFHSCNYCHILLYHLITVACIFLSSSFATAIEGLKADTVHVSSLN